MKDESINSLHSFLLIPFVIRERKQREGKNPPLQISKLPADLIRKLFSKKKKKKKERREKLDKIFDLIAAWTKSWGGEGNVETGHGDSLAAENMGTILLTKR